MGQVVGEAPDVHASKAAMAAGPDHDEVDVLALCRFEQRVGLAGEQQRSARRAAPAERLGPFGVEEAFG